LTVDGGGTGTVRLEGPLVGAAALVKQGGFGLVLGGANAGWTGNLIVTDGFVSATAATALTGNNVTVHRGGRLAVLADVAVGSLALTNNVTSSAATGPGVRKPPRPLQGLPGAGTSGQKSREPSGHTARPKIG
jgi:hypothetical protein